MCIVEVKMATPFKRMLRKVLTPTQVEMLQRPELLFVKPSIGFVSFGDLDTLEPISRVWGYDRGVPIDRYYIENFLKANADCIRGRVLEVAENTYTLRYGGDAVTQSDILFPSEGNPGTTIIADLTDAHNIPDNSFDCLILTQVLHIIYDYRAALSHIHRILKPGGTLLLTVPGGIANIAYPEGDDFNDWWRFTRIAMEKLLGEYFPPQNVDVRSWGNVKVGGAYLYGLSMGDLKRSELDHHDPMYQLVVTATATK
jgi:SAM-dependent methyltransferase